jgi:hypothetical protein
MSTFLGFESFKISLGASVQDVQDTFQTALSSYGWQIKRKSIIPIAYPTSSLPNYMNAFNMSTSSFAGGVYGVGSGIIGMQLETTYTPTLMYLACGDGSQAPNTFVLEYSPDGTTWYPLQTWSNETNWYIGEQRVYNVVGAGGYAYWRLRINSANANSGNYLTVEEWALEDASFNRTTTNRFFDVIPPAMDGATPNPIGNSNAFDVLRIGIGSNYVNFQGLQYSKVYTPQVVALWAKNGGAVACAMTLNGTTVTGATGGPTSSAYDNFRSLYEAIKTSTAPNITDWTWEFFQGYIYGTKKVGAPWITMTPNGNTNGTTISGPSVATVQGTMMFDTTNTTIYTDLIDGFIYYLQVNARGIALATKTTGAFYGPIHACYADNTKALAVIPESGFALKCTPIELLIGWDDTTANSGSFARPTHVWGVSNQTVQGIGNTAASSPYDATWGTPFGKGRIRDKILDYYMHYSYYQNYNVSLFGSGLFSGASVVGRDFQIHRVNCAGETLGGNDSSILPITPALDISDWYKFVGTSTEEALMMSADNNLTTTVASIITVGDSIINVTSTAGFQTAGWLVIENEIIQYTGISGNSFTGCTRAHGNTSATAHFTDDVVAQGLWFTKINGGVLLCGYNEPV